MAPKRRGRIIEKKQNRGIKRPVDDSTCGLASLRSDKYHAASEKPGHVSSIKPMVGRETLFFLFLFLCFFEEESKMPTTSLKNW